jgi:hypothetical protein
VKNVTACSARRFVMGRTSTHLENLSIATNRWVKPPGAFRKGPTMSSPPHGERPCNGDGLQDVRREVGFTGVELAPFAGVHDLAGVGDRGGLVEALAERVAYEGAGARHCGRRCPRECPGGARAPRGWALLTVNNCIKVRS